MALTRRMRAIVATGLVAIGASFSAMPAEATDYPSGGGSSPAEMAEGSSRWQGETPANVDALITKLGTYVDSFPAHLGGVALSPDSQGVNLYVVATVRQKLPSDLMHLISDNEGLIHIVEVEHSYAELRQIQEEYSHDVPDGFVSSAVDIVGNKVILGAEANSIAMAHFGSLKPLRTHSQSLIDIQELEQAEDAAGRYNDYPRYYMGGSMSRGGTICSLGVPIVVDGVRGVLTAGHCGVGTFTTPRGKFVGSTYTTAYPGNANKYGDWQILYGSTYAPHIFSGPANSPSDSHHRISGASKRWPGQKVCHSGQTTGQYCRYVVDRVDVTLKVNGVMSSHQTSVYHDSDLNGLSDCSGWQGGDSGGPIYSASSKSVGTVDVHGIVKGYSVSSLGKCRYYYTQLSGLTAWRTSARVDY